jgi:uncharacterized membrane protein (UPF0127 family)
LGLLVIVGGMMRMEINGVDAVVARTLLQRMKGLIGYRDLPSGQGMLIEKCNAIHTFFMKFPIDAVFFDRNGNVVKTVKHIKPWTFMVWGGWKAVSVLETKSGI